MGMDWADFTSLFNFVAIWIQPIFWMFFFYSKTKKFDRIAKIAMPTTAIFLAVLYALKFFFPEVDGIYNTYPMFSLYSLYIVLGFSFATYLMASKQWKFPQAISISTLVTFIGGFYWQSPYLVSNAFILGFQLDWVLHLTGLMFVWFVANTTGWKTDKASLSAVALGFVITIVFMLGWYIPPNSPAHDSYKIWNSPYYMLDRAVCTVIAFLAIKKTAPFWRKRK